MNESSLRKKDFPTWITPSLVKELRQGMRSPAFLITMSVFPSILAIIFLFSFIKGTTGFIIPQSLGNGLFWSLISFCLLTVIPLRALTAVKEEIDTKSINLLILTKLSSNRIIWGKWISLMAQAAMISFLTLPFACIRYYYGDINILQDIVMLGIIFASGALLTALCLWLSGMPVFMRVIATIALVQMGILSAIMCSEASSIFAGDFYEPSFWILGATILFDTGTVILLSLLLATKWFASPSENIAARIRKTMLLIFVPFALLLLPENMISENFIGLQSIISFLVITAVLVLEASIPETLLPSHIVKTANHRFGWLSRFAFLPGWPGAARFSILLGVILSGLLIFIFSCDDSLAYKFFSVNKDSWADNNREFYGIMQVFGFPLTWWSSIVTILWIISPLQKKLGSWTPIIFGFTAALFFFITAIFYNLGSIGSLLAQIIPCGSFIALMHGDAHPILTIISVIPGIIATLIGSSEWKSTNAKGMLLLREKRSSSKSSSL